MQTADDDVGDIKLAAYIAENYLAANLQPRYSRLTGILNTGQVFVLHVVHYTLRALDRVHCVRHSLNISCAVQGRVVSWNPLV